MTPDRIEELQAQFIAASRRVDQWCIYQGNSRTAKGMETVLTMLQARQAAEELMKALLQEATEGLMLRSAYMDATYGERPTAH